MKWIVKENMPFNTVSSPDFGELMQCANKAVIPISRMTISRDITVMHSIAKGWFRNILKVRLSKTLLRCNIDIYSIQNCSSKVFLTLDGWTSASNDSYMAINVHYIAKWHLKRVCLSFKGLEGSKTGAHLSHALCTALAEADITNKVRLL